MNRELEEAFAEVEQVIKLMPVELSVRIPIKLRKSISENKAKDYEVNIKEPLEEQELKQETIVILGLLYRDFIASPEEREQLQLEDDEEIKRIEEEMQKKYDINEVFEKRKSNSNVNESTEMMVYKEPSFIKKLFNLVKGIFKKNKF